MAVIPFICIEILQTSTIRKETITLYLFIFIENKLRVGINQFYHFLLTSFYFLFAKLWAYTKPVPILKGWEKRKLGQLI